MPANPKYLEKSNWQKFAKLSAGIIGGYIISVLIHLNLTILLAPYHKEVLITSVYTIFTLWVVLLILPYLFKSGWKVLLLYLTAILILLPLFLFLKPYNPFV